MSRAVSCLVTTQRKRKTPLEDSSPMDSAGELIACLLSAHYLCLKFQVICSAD